MRRLTVLDLFSGFGGFSEGFKSRLHNVITVDIDAHFRPSIQKDINSLSIEDLKMYMPIHVVTCSPPCVEFSKMSLPKSWNCNKKLPQPDTSLLESAVKIIKEINPSFYIIENVKGAIPYFESIVGYYSLRCGSRYFWGNFPHFEPKYYKEQDKSNVSHSRYRSALRAKIPYEVSLSLCLACESAFNLGTGQL